MKTADLWNFVFFYPPFGSIWIKRPTGPDCLPERHQQRARNTIVFFFSYGIRFCREIYQLGVTSSDQFSRWTLYIDLVVVGLIYKKEIIMYFVVNLFIKRSNILTVIPTGCNLENVARRTCSCSHLEATECFCNVVHLTLISNLTTQALSHTLPIRIDFIWMQVLPSVIMIVCVCPTQQSVRNDLLYTYRALT